MTSKQLVEKFPKLSGWTRWINTSILLAIGVGLWGYSVKMQTILETRTFTTVQNKVAVEKVAELIENIELMDSITTHMKNEELHKPYTIMNKLWVPRVEIEEKNTEIIKYMNQLSAQVGQVNLQVAEINKMIKQFIKSK